MPVEAEERSLTVMVQLVTDIAGGYKVISQFSRAQQLYRESLAMMRRLHGADADHADVATSLNDLASVLHAQGDVAESAHLHRESLAME